MKIQKVLNSSVVLAVAENGEESILLGKGIGYGRKTGEDIERQSSDRVFIPLSHPEMQRTIELFSSIPTQYLDVTQEIVSLAEKTLQVKLSDHIYPMLMDHLHFAVERQRQGILVTNRVFWEIKNFYRKEFEVGKAALQLIHDQLGVELPEEEAANIAFHIVNASKDVSTQYDAMKAAKLISNLVNIVTYTTGCQLDTESTHYFRFINHLQFFADRYYGNSMLDSKDDFLYQQMQESYPVAVTCAEKIRTYLLHSDNIFLPNEEIAYLAMHIARLISRN